MRAFKRSLVTVCCLLVGSLTGGAAELKIQSEASFDKRAFVPKAVAEKCPPLGRQLSENVLHSVQRYFRASAWSGEPEGQDDLLVKLTILSISATQGGSWTGRKTMAARMDLHQGGKPIDFVVRISQERGLVAGNCELLAEISEEVSEKFVVWLRKNQAKYIPGELVLKSK